MANFVSFGESFFAKLPNEMKFAKWNFPFGESFFVKLPNELKFAKGKFPFGESFFAKLPNESKFAIWKSPFGKSFFAKLPNANFYFSHFHLAKNAFGSLAKNDLAKNKYVAQV